MPATYSGTQSVVRAIRLLKLFNGQQSEWSLQQLVDASQLNKTTVFRMLTALESEGLLERTVAGNYQLGPEIIALGGRAVRNNELRDVVHSVLKQLAQATKERATLEILLLDTDGTYVMMVVDEVNSSYLIRVEQSVGSRVPIHATSTGKAMLAYMAEDERDLALQQAFGTYTETTITDKARVSAELEHIRRRGYAVALGELEVGLLAAGAPIFNFAGEPVGCISVEGPSQRVDEARLHDMARLVVDAAAEISEKLGYKAN